MSKLHLARRLAAALLLFAAGAAQAQPAPETPTVTAAHQPVFAQHDMVAAAHPLAAEAGREMLRDGGTAIDAAIAAALVLNLVEPQSAGLGGGGFLVFYSAAERRVVTFDGRETAPLAAKPDRFLKPDGTPMAFFDAVVGGRSVGVPGFLRMLELAHRRYGKLGWAKLFAPAIRLASDGFPVSSRLHMLLAGEPYLPKSPSAKNYFYDDGKPLAEGAIVKNPLLAQTFKTLAAHGARAFYRGDIAHDIVRALHDAPVPGDLTEDDLAAYSAKERAPVCGYYRSYRICGMGPPSSGDVTLIEMLGMLEHFPAAKLDLVAPGAVQLFTQAGRLSFADRDRYLADTDFVRAPVAGLLNGNYLAERAKLIDPEHDMAQPAQPGEPPEPAHRHRHAALGDDASPELPSTTHVAIVDRAGNAVSMTNSIENQFGSRIFVDGFLLNNELTDFSFPPEQDGKPVANAVAAGKRPRSSMSPTIVFDKHLKLRLVVGSAGGPAIIQDVAKTIVATLDGKMDIQAAIDLMDIGNRNGTTEIEAGPQAEALAAALKAMGHKVAVAPHSSGLQAVAVTDKGLEGAADSRRDGAARGD
jgi:gamma-glutamyltranspeptidase/glutathione hydrolase